MNQPSPTGLRRVRRESGCFPPGLGSSSAPSCEGKSGCGGLGVISVFEGTQGGFLVQLWVQQCAPAPSRAFLPSWAASPEQVSVSAKGFPCSLSFPISPQAFPWGFLGAVCSTLGCLWQDSLDFLVTDRDFVLGACTGDFVPPVTCRAGCPGAGGSLGMSPSVSVPARCSECPGSKGCCHGDLTLGGTRAVFHL